MPFVGDLPAQAKNLVAPLAPYLDRYGDYPATNSGPDR